VQRLGTKKWTEIKGLLDGRSADQIKRRWAKLSAQLQGGDAS